MTCRRAFLSARKHAAGVQRRDAECVGSLIAWPAQILRPRRCYTEGAANRARPPAAGKQLRRIDAQADARNGFVTGNRRFEKSLAAVAVLLRNDDQRRNNHCADTGSSTAMNVIE